MLEALGVWQEIESKTQPFNQIIVTDSRKTSDHRPSLLSFLGQSDGDTASAWMLENPVLLAALICKVEANANIDVRTGIKVETLNLVASPAIVATTEGDNFAADLIIAADGKSSLMRRQAGIEVIGWEYGQSGIAMTVEHELPHKGRAEEHFRQPGPFAILPLTGNRSSIVWTEKTSAAEKLVAMPKDEFLLEFKKRFGSHLGEVTLASPYASWPLSLQIAKSFIAPRLALVGDAAHIVHPIAGLGFNLGLRDIAALADCVFDQIRLGLDHGGKQTLDTYEKWRRADTIMVAAASDGLNRLFSNDNLPTTAIRQAGLKIVDQIQPLKTFFMDRAAGITGRQPRLMTGEPL
jgi:2-octaprenyl-6-methoxyphenol hydroxylase